MGAFGNAINHIPNLSNALKPGLVAVKNVDRKRFSINNTQSLEGSVDLDKALAHACPDDNRWDYIIGYDSMAYFAEVHPASSQQEVNAMIKKASWLNSWLNCDGSPLRSIAYRPFFWIPTSGVSPQIQTVQRRKLAQSGIIIAKPLSLPPKY